MARKMTINTNFMGPYCLLNCIVINIIMSKKDFNFEGPHILRTVLMYFCFSADLIKRVLPHVISTALCTGAVFWNLIFNFGMNWRS